MCRSRLFVLCLLVATNVSAQDDGPPPRAPSTKEKEQALAVLTEARSALFPVRRKAEARQLFGQVALLAAVAGDRAGAQEVLTLLPASVREAVQTQIVAAQVRAGELEAALETARAISADDAQAAALLLVVEGRAKSAQFDEAMRTAALIAPGRVESVQALVEVAQQQKLAGKRTEAMQLLRRAATATSNLVNSNREDPDCGLSVLAQIANAQESLGESAEAMKTLQMAEGRVPEADPDCKSGAARFLQDDDQGRPEVLKNEIAGFRERLVTSANSIGDEEQNEQDSPSADENASDPLPTNPSARASQGGQTQPPTLSKRKQRSTRCAESSRCT